MTKDPFAELGPAFQEAAEKTLAEAGALGVQLARNTNKFRIGKLHDAIGFYPIDKYSGFVIADKPYAYWLEYGNDQGGPYIYPKTAKALHFFVDGQEVFAKKVRSHGPYWFMRDSQEEVIDAIPEMFLKNLKEQLW